VKGGGDSNGDSLCVGPRFPSSILFSSDVRPFFCAVSASLRVSVSVSVGRIDGMG
jgi:hypothetical protein